MGKKIAACLLILLLATVTRFYHLGHQSLWSDEGNSVILARAGFAEIADRTAFDIHPPLYYWLLKSWIACFGESEFGVRSLSAVLAVLLVGGIYYLGRRLFGQAAGLAAMFIAALAPFQVYYAQETRMYMLLTLLGTLCVALALELWFPVHFETRTGRILVAGSYSLIVTMGLYTQYAFPIILAVINLVALFVLWPLKSQLWAWVRLQTIPLMLYLPWLPVAFRQITTWPALRETASLTEIGLTLIETMSLGVWAEDISKGWLVVFGGLALFGVAVEVRRWWMHVQSLYALTLVLLWLLLPAGLAIQLFRPAYLKIFLIASPAFCLLVGLGLVRLGGYGGPMPYIKSVNTAQTDLRSSPECAGTSGLNLIRLPWLAQSGWLKLVSRLWRPLLSYLAILLVAIPSILALDTYYHDRDFQRDNYRGIAAFIKAVGTKDDIVIVHAPGQQEVFGYYYQSGPEQATVIPLPRQRPLDPLATIVELEILAARANRIYGVYWATTEADPKGLIEDWLNQHTFKARDIWFGNVRLVSYAAETAEMIAHKTNFQLGEHIRLQGVSLSNDRLAPGEILQIELVWETDSSLTENYIVFVQLLDEANHLVGQRDARPLTPTIDWIPTQAMIDKHGLYLEPGTPPGEHRLIAGLYDSATGVRLPLVDAVTGSMIEGQNFVTLATVSVVKNRSALPGEAFQIQHILNMPPLLGYDLYKSGYASNPEVTLYRGDPLHINLYWQKPAVLPANDQIELRLIDRKQIMISQWQQLAAGVNYPFDNWTKGEVVRSQFDLFLPEVPPADYQLEILLSGVMVGKTKVFAVAE